MQPTGEWLRKPGGLAERLKRLRQASGLTGAQLAERLGWKTRSRIPKLERGQQMPTEADIIRWADACGHPEEAPELLAMLTEGQAVHEQWRHTLRRGHAALQAEFDNLVRDAKRIRNFEVMLIPGLLQTADYFRYRALEAVRLQGTDPDKVEETIAARMRRQEALYDTSKTFEFIVCESALRYLLCPPQVMAGQLDRLLAISGLGNVTLGIIPPGRELAVAPMVGFLMVDDLTVVETFTSKDDYTGPESAAYDRIADGLMAEAVTGDEARRLITAAAADLRDLRRVAVNSRALCRTVGGMANIKLTVYLLPKSVDSLDRLHERSGDTKTDLINRALQVYDYLESAIAEGGDILIRPKDGAAEVLRII